MLFVNRESELQLVEESFKALQDKQLLLRNPIIEVSGVSGIGKTSLLKQVQERCQGIAIPCIWINVDQSTTQMMHEIIVQVKQKIHPNTAVTVQNTHSAVEATQVLLSQGPVVMLFDAVETASDEQLGKIETLLRDLIEDQNLFVMLASQKMLEFQKERSVARKLRSLPLKSLDHENCNLYLARLDQPIPSEIREIIFEWTHGYPLAMYVMAEAVNRGLDPRTDEGRQQILQEITRRVINEELLGQVEDEHKPHDFTLLRLLSVPRRINYLIMQKLIENFAPNLKRRETLNYFSLPKYINEKTQVLNWNMERGGYSVDTPVRNIFLLLYQQTHPEEYVNVHTFLAEINLTLARQVDGYDRVRYTREYLYHLVNDPRIIDQEQLIEAAVQDMLQSPQVFQQFSEEFAQDHELKDALGIHLAHVQIIIADKKLHLNQNQL